MSAVVVLDLTTGAILARDPLASRIVAPWRDRVALIVEDRETRSDSDWGNAGVYALEFASHAFALRDDLGRDIAGGQLSSEPVFDGDFAYAIAGGRLHAYRMTP